MVIYNLEVGKMEKEGPQDLGSGRSSVTAFFQSDVQRYLTHLKLQFGGTDIEGLAKQVEKLLEDTMYKTAVERAVTNLRGVAEQSGFIKTGNALTRRARFHLGDWYPFAQGLPTYREYAQRGLDEIVRGYKPRETK